MDFLGCGTFCNVTSGGQSALSMIIATACNEGNEDSLLSLVKERYKKKFKLVGLRVESLLSGSRII